MDKLVEKAAVLHEAIPYIRRFRGRIFVIKYGGHAMLDEELKELFARDVCLLRYVGIHVVVVHGGGPQIDETLELLGVPSSFSGGLRVTDDATMKVVEMVLAGRVNQDIVGLISKHGGRAVGLTGKDDGFMLAGRREPVAQRDADGATESIDLGRVGRIRHVKPELLRGLLDDQFLPVVAPIAVDEQGRALNVNADEAAAAIAAALGAAKLVLMTDVPGVKDRDGKLLSALDARTAETLIADGTIHGGMIPKVRQALDAVHQGVEKTHILDGRTRHALLLEFFTDEGVGTLIRVGGSVTTRPG